MRKFINLPNCRNKELSKNYSHFLKGTEECTPDDCKWVSVSVFDHWLHKSNSYSLVENANELQKSEWTSQIHNFLRELVQIEKPIYFRLTGKHTKPRLQFRDYIGIKPLERFFCEQYDEIYEPRVLFESMSFQLMFEDNWTLCIIYNDVNKLEVIFKLLEKNNMYTLPTELIENLNQYSEVKGKLIEMKLNKLISKEV